jgi:hypothetical protein
VGRGAEYAIIPGERWNGTKKTIHSGLDPLHVFGSPIREEDLIRLLKARTAHIQSGTGSMAGERDSLMYVILSTLGQAAAPGAIDAIAKTLQDPSRTAGDWALIALIRIGEERVDLRQEIAAKIRSSGVDITTVSSRGEKVPSWLSKPDGM